MTLREAARYQCARARAFGKRNGNDWIRARIWNWEFRTGKWDHIESSPDNPVYEMIERYVARGRLLDLACGAGAVRCDLPAGAISGYVGVDISSHAIRRAQTRAAALAPLPRGQLFLVGSMTDNATQLRIGDGFDVVLFNECLYYVPAPTVPELFADLSTKLSANGVFIFRIHDRERWASHVDAIRKSLRVVEDKPSTTSRAITLAASPH